MTASAALPLSRIDATLIRGLEASKWLAIILMVFSHAGMGAGGSIAWPAFWIGRVCAPMFSFIIVARLSEKPEERSLRYLVRLLAWGVPAQVPYYLWTHTFGIHVDTLILLALGVVTVRLWVKGFRTASILLSAGFIVAAGASNLELLAAPIMMIGYIFYQRSPSLGVLAISAGYAAIPLYHHPQEVLAPALCMLTPLLMTACGLAPVHPARLPGWFFYGIYPLQFVLIFLIFGQCPPMQN